MSFNVDKIIKQGFFKGRSGDKYLIQPDLLPAARANNFEDQCLELGSGKDYETRFNEYVQINQLSTSCPGNDLLKNMQQIASISGNNMHEMAEFNKHPINRFIKFCALFCNKEEEDITRYDTDLVKAKADDWSHIPYSFFLHLAAIVIPGFLAIYQKTTKDIRSQIKTDIDIV